MILLTSNYHCSATGLSYHQCEAQVVKCWKPHSAHVMLHHDARMNLSQMSTLIQDSLRLAFYVLVITALAMSWFISRCGYDLRSKGYFVVKVLGFCQKLYMYFLKQRIKVGCGNLFSFHDLITQGHFVQVLSKHQQCHGSQVTGSNILQI